MPLRFLLLFLLITIQTSFAGVNDSKKPFSCRSLKSFRGQSEFNKKFVDRFLEKAKKEYTSPALKDYFPATGSIGYTSLDRILSLVCLYEYYGESKYLNKAKNELAWISSMLNEGVYKDWKSETQFLATADTMLSVILGYQHLRNHLSKNMKATIFRGIFRKALINYEMIFAGNFVNKQKWWVNSKSNWNFVSSGSLITATTIMLRDIDSLKSELSQHENKKRLISLREKGMNSLKNGFYKAGRHGGWYEGLGYWGYAMKYVSIALETLIVYEDSLLLLNNISGLKERLSNTVVSSYFMHTLSSNQYLPYAYSDSSSGYAHALPATIFLSKLLNVKGVISFEKNKIANVLNQKSHRVNKDYFYLRWMNIERLESKLGTVRNVNVSRMATFRDRYNNLGVYKKDDVYLGFKGGVTDKQHRQFDNGSFIFEIMGERWVTDPGAPIYVEGLKWRQRTKAHSVLMISNSDQNEAASKLRQFAYYRKSNSDWKNSFYGSVDLTDAYKKKKSSDRGLVNLKSYFRGYLYSPSNRILIVKDNLDTTIDSRTRKWLIQTSAKVHSRFNNKRAVRLKKNGKFLKVFAIGSLDSDKKIKVKSYKPSGNITNPQSSPIHNHRTIEFKSSEKNLNKIFIVFVPQDSPHYSKLTSVSKLKTLLKSLKGGFLNEPVSKW